MLLDGIHVPLTTPFYPDSRLNVRKLEHNVRRYSLTPVNGLAALSSVSETQLLSDAERRIVLQTVGAEAAREKVLLAGVGLPSVRESVSLAEAAAGFGFDTVMVGMPVDYARQLSDDSAELLTYFQAIADGSPLPVLLVSEASRAVLPVALIDRLKDHPNVVGLLEQSSHIGRVSQVRELAAKVRRTVTTTITFTAATGRMLQGNKPGEVVGGSFVSAEQLGGGVAVATAPPVPALKTRTKEVGFQVLWGNATEATAALRAGANGLLPALAASVPQAAFEVWAAWKDGDAALMREKESRLSKAEAGIAEWDIPAIKSGAELSGYFGGRPRLPLLSPTAERTAEIAALLNGMRS
jgi:dihydrodipicolinate synthase/N-acetylneuraminate lyase